MTLQTDVLLKIGATQQSALDLGNASFALPISVALSLASGTGAAQADLMFTDTRTISASSSENLDLAGSLVDALGATLTFVKVKGLYVRAAVGNTNNVVVGGAASNAFVNWISGTTPAIILPPGAAFIWIDGTGSGAAVTASTGDILKVANSGGTTGVTYDIVIIGTSA